LQSGLFFYYSKHMLCSNPPFFLSFPATSLLHSVLFTQYYFSFMALLNDTILFTMASSLNEHFFHLSVFSIYLQVVPTVSNVHIWTCHCPLFSLTCFHFSPRTVTYIKTWTMPQISYTVLKIYVLNKLLAENSIIT
jgi:hypothetical protein